MGKTTVGQLQAVLNERRELLSALPGVTGWGVGLNAEEEPIIHVFVSAAPSDDLVGELGRLLDRFEVVVQCRPAEEY